MKSEDLPKSVNSAMDILLNYQEHTTEELIKAQKILGAGIYLLLI